MQQTRPPWLARVCWCVGAVFAAEVNGRKRVSVVISHKRRPQSNDAHLWKESPRVGRSTHQPPPSPSSPSGASVEQRTCSRLFAVPGVLPGVTLGAFLGGRRLARTPVLSCVLCSEPGSCLPPSLDFERRRPILAPTTLEVYFACNEQRRTFLCRRSRPGTMGSFVPETRLAIILSQR
jgi:hypothetical protein